MKFGGEIKAKGFSITGANATRGKVALFAVLILVSVGLFGSIYYPIFASTTPEGAGFGEGSAIDKQNMEILLKERIKIRDFFDSEQMRGEHSKQWSDLWKQKDFVDNFNNTIDTLKRADFLGNKSAELYFNSFKNFGGATKLTDTELKTVIRAHLAQSSWSFLGADGKRYYAGGGVVFTLGSNEVINPDVQKAIAEQVRQNLLNDNANDGKMISLLGDGKPDGVNNETLDLTKLPKERYEYYVKWFSQQEGATTDGKSNPAVYFRAGQQAAYNGRIEDPEAFQAFLNDNPQYNTIFEEERPVQSAALITPASLLGVATDFAARISAEGIKPDLTPEELAKAQADAAKQKTEEAKWTAYREGLLRSITKDQDKYKAVLDDTAYTPFLRATMGADPMSLYSTLMGWGVYHPKQLADSTTLSLMSTYSVSYLTDPESSFAISGNGLIPTGAGGYPVDAVMGPFGGNSLDWFYDVSSIYPGFATTAAYALAGQGNQGLVAVLKKSSSDSLFDVIVKKPQALAQAVVQKKDHPWINLADVSFPTSISIDPKTAGLVYTTTIVSKTDPTKTLGFLRYNPVTQTVDARLTAEVAGKQVTLSSDPRNNQVYLSVGNVDQSALYKVGQLQLMQVRVASDGSFGGEFKYGDRIFNYNPSTKAFEVPINITQKGKIYFAQNPKAEDASSDKIRGTIYLDSKGGVTGSYEVISSQPKGGGVSQSGSLFFDQSGNIGFTYVASETVGNVTRDIGGISLDMKGNIGGNINLGKALNFKSDVFLGFDKNGLSSLGGNIGSSGVSANVSLRTGALSFGTFIPIGPVPVPVGLGQNNRGDFSITFPGGSVKLCSLGIGKCESRSDVPTVPKADAEGTVDFSAVQCQHSYKQLLQTVKIYNDAKVEGEAAQKERSAALFAAFNKYYGRNPGTQEYIDWYFIMNNQRGNGTYSDWQCNVIDLFKYNLDKTLSATKEGKCFAQNGGATAATTATSSTKGKDRSTTGACPAPPADLMQSDPLNPAGTTTETPATSTDNSNAVDEFMNGIEQAAAEDPLWNGSGWTGLGESADTTNAKISLSKGYNAFFVPSNMESVNASVFDKTKFVLFSFNGDGTKKWYSSEKANLPKYLEPNRGYYIYAFNDKEEVPLSAVSGAKTSVQIYQGWNLLSNDTDKAAKLSELSYKTVKTASCKSIDCTEDKTLRELYAGAKGYSKIYVVTDDKATDAAKAFDILTVSSSNADTLTIPEGKIFWFYLK